MMDQNRKRRLNTKRSGLSHCKVQRPEEPDDSRHDSKGSNRRFTKIRASSPQFDTACYNNQEQHAGCSHTPEDDADRTLVITFDKEQGVTRPVGRRKGSKRKKEAAGQIDAQQETGEDEIQPEVEIDPDLDRELENKSRQHNLTSANVRNIIHEVITNEHVVAMMKAAINELEPVPVFEPKMTRSKLKEVVEKGVVIPAWNISPIKKPTGRKKGPQFVDIPLEEEDSSDEEYRPDEEEEDETAEETLPESDLESSVSSPRGNRGKLYRSQSEHEDDSSSRTSRRRSRHLTVDVAPMGPPPPPPAPSGAPDCSFLEKLHAVDEELAIGPQCMEPYQSLSSTNADESVISFRTRSKRPLRDVPLGRLEAELHAPDITPDMYGSAPEDREWTQWLQGLMTSDMENDEEGDDEDDPEYNFLADIDEPDVEDYRNDKAVRITKKEVNALMEELFDAFQDELGGQDEEEEEKEEEEISAQEPPAILDSIQCVEDPMADVLKQRYRTVREQLEAVRKRKALLESKGVPVPPPCPRNPSSALTPMNLSRAQKLQLQQQIQQHVQLLTQVNMLSTSVKGLEAEASTSKQFLLELQMFAQHEEHMRGSIEPGFTSIFRACNLQGALSLLEELTQSPTLHTLCFPGSQFPAHLAWMMATRSVFLYPELLPVAQLRPFRSKGPFTSAEDCLLVLGHKHMRSTLHPLQMTCHYLLAARSFLYVKTHIKDACQKPFHNVIKTYFLEGKCPPMPLACKKVSPCDQRPPVERERSLMPHWLLKNLKLICEHAITLTGPSGDSSSQTTKLPERITSSMIDNVRLSALPGPQRSFPPNLPEDLAETLKNVRGGKKKKAAQKPSKPVLSTEEMEILSHMPAILPKAATVPSPSLNQPPHLPQGVDPEMQADSLCPELNPCQSIAINCPVKTPIIASKPLVGQNQGVTQGKVFITLPSHPGPVVAPNVAAPNHQGGLIITLPPSHDPFICPTPIFIKPPAGVPLNTNQSYGALLKLIPKSTGGLVAPQSVSQKHLKKCLLLPSGYVFASKSQATKPRQIFRRAPNRTRMKRIMKKRTPVNTAGGPPVIQETIVDSTQETGEEECDSRDLFLTLSESSGSPEPNIEDNNNFEMGEEKLEEQEATEKTDSSRGTLEEETDGVSEVLPVSELQETTDDLSELDTKTQSEKEPNSESHQSLGEHHGMETSSVLYNDTLDDDPHRDAKDVAFAQAYLQKVYEALQVDPGKLEEFLGVLSEFERDPESHSSLELLRRLEPVLSDWPELLRDFAAFLHPDQAQECGLLAEQQAFERSRRFLRQLEDTFGEQSALYRKVVCILQGSLSHAGSKEIHAQIKLMFHDHTDLLEEFWVYFRQLHPQVQWCSDEEDDDAESTVQTLKDSKRSQPCCPTITRSPDNKTASKRRIKRDKHLQMNEIRKLNAKNTMCTDMEKVEDEDPSADGKKWTTEASVCAKNSSHTPNGKKVVLWTREADRVLLTTCQQRGARMATFRAIAGQLGNKTATEVSERFQDLIKLFQRSSKLNHTGPSYTEEHPNTIEDEPD